MPQGVCPKCGWKAPEGLLKCPFCKTYIRVPGSSTATDLRVPAAVAPPSSEDPSLPPPDPLVVKAVKRQIGRELFDDSDVLQAYDEKKIEEMAAAAETSEELEPMKPEPEEKKEPQGG